MHSRHIKHTCDTVENLCWYTRNATEQYIGITNKHNENDAAVLNTKCYHVKHLLRENPH